MNRLKAVLLCLFVAVAMQAQIRGNSVVVAVEPDHADWKYKVGEKVNYTVEVRREGTLVKNASIDYQMGPDP